MDKNKLMFDLKEQIIDQLNLQDTKPEDIGDDQSLFADGLGLDSIDALELIFIMQQNYNVKLAKPEDGPKVFRSISTMADFIISQQ
jgi:acyl carrier protein